MASRNYKQMHDVQLLFEQDKLEQIKMKRKPEVEKPEAEKPEAEKPEVEKPDENKNQMLKQLKMVNTASILRH